MIKYDINQVNIAVYDKVREYYKIDKKLGGLIKVFITEHIEKISRDIAIFIPDIERDDTITINGVEFVPKKGDVKQ